MKQPVNSYGFHNEPMLDFRDERVRRKIAEALAAMHVDFCKNYPLLIDGKEVWTQTVHERENPSNKKEIVGRICMADTALAASAISAARAGQKEWGERSQDERSTIMHRAAALLRESRFFFLALMAWEVGKDRENADGEIAEAIDFFDFYAKTALWLHSAANSALVPVLGEENSVVFKPAGVVASIQPWNFPLSLSAGTIAAALVMGNAVVYKPAEESCVIGYHLVKLLYEAGVPKDVLHYLPGKGEVVGDYLVEHSLVGLWQAPYDRAGGVLHAGDNLAENTLFTRAGESDLVCFTGSEAVGREIEYRIARYNHDVLPRLSPKDCIPKMKPVVEKGGNGFTIVDAGADYDAALEGILTAAFGYQGQKCSAGRRVILVGQAYERLMPRLKKCIEDLPIGPAHEEKYKMGAVISEESYERLVRYINPYKEAGNVLAEGVVPDEYRDRGYFFPPVLVGNVSPDSPIAQEETFGPILVALRAKDFAEAIEIANGTAYALTGSVYSRNPQHIEQAKREMCVGNKYVNKKSTGAVVARQPFGGMKLSGDGQSKAGGLFYLLQFVRMPTISENTQRRGYASIRQLPTSHN